MTFKIAFALAGIAALSACSGNIGGPFDKPLPHPDAENVGIWVSPQGCQSWYFIDGTGAFMSPRVGSNGRPVCTAPALPPKAPASR